MLAGVTGALGFAAFGIAAVAGALDHPALAAAIGVAGLALCVGLVVRPTLRDRHDVVWIGELGIHHRSRRHGQQTGLWAELAGAWAMQEQRASFLDGVSWRSYRIRLSFADGLVVDLDEGLADFAALEANLDACGVRFQSPPRGS